jgi:beta-phosphoglucomutase-like phosphatase (HAD superfamily)
MADNINNEKLDQYNDSLRESLNLSKLLSDNIVALAGSMARVDMAGRSTLSGLKEIGKDIQKTIGLTDKLNSGKLKEKEVSLQIAKLQQDYNKYISDTENGINNINNLTQRQLDLQTEIAREEASNEARRNRVNNTYAQLDDLQRRLIDKNNEINNAAVQLRGALKDQAAELRQQIRDTNAVLNADEKRIDSSEKLLSKQKKEQEQIENILYAHDRLVDSYTDEIKANEALIEALKEQGLLYRLNSGNIDKISSSLKDIQNLFAPFTAIFEFIKKIAFSASDQVVRIQKGLVASKEEAYELRQGFNDAAVASGNIAVNTERMVAANAELGKQLGFNSRFSNDMNEQFIMLTKQIGLSENAAGGLAKLSKASGMNFRDTKNVVLETTQRLSSQYGIQLDQKDVLEEVGKISGQTLAMLKGNPKALAEAVAQSRLLGTNLENVKKQASALLDFETSIENELQAELITGQQFNLERARSAALTGDLSTAMKELSNQGLDFNKYSNMNVIAQDKVAAAMGLTSDEMTDQLMKMQYMGKSREQIVALAGEEVANRIEAISAQDKFNLAMEKMQDIVGKLVGGPLGQFADMMATLLDNSVVLYGIMGTIAAISFTKLVAGLAASAVQAGLLAAGSATAASALSFGVGAIAIAAAITGIAAAYTAFQDDATSVGDMFSSKGKTVVSTSEGGLFSLSENDEFAAAPGLGDMINRPTQQITATQDNSAVVSAIASLNDTMKSVKDGVGQLYNKSGNIMLDSQKVGTAQVLGNYNLA